MLTKLCLALVFALGAALMFMGWRGQVVFNGSGFTSEAAFQAIYRLSDDVEMAWETGLQPALDHLDAGNRETLDAIVSALTGADGESEAVWKRLYATYLAGGPKVSTAAKKAITGMNDGEAAAFRQALQECLLDEGAAIPEAKGLPDLAPVLALGALAADGVRPVSAGSWSLRAFVAMFLQRAADFQEKLDDPIDPEDLAKARAFAAGETDFRLRGLKAVGGRTIFSVCAIPREDIVAAAKFFVDAAEASGDDASFDLDDEDEKDEAEEKPADDAA